MGVQAHEVRVLDNYIHDVPGGWCPNHTPSQCKTWQGLARQSEAFQGLSTAASMHPTSWTWASYHAPLPALAFPPPALNKPTGAGVHLVGGSRNSDIQRNYINPFKVCHY